MHKIPIIIIALFVLAGPYVATAQEADQNAAPFGLKWGMSKEEVQATGVILTKGDDSQDDTLYAASKLPKVIEDAELVGLSFGYNNKLMRIIALSRTFANDPYGAALKDRYDALAKILEEKYGHGTQVQHRDESIYSKDEHFLMGIEAGLSWYYTNYDTPTLMAQLGIFAKNSSDGGWKLIFTNKALQKEFEKDKKQKEKSAL